MIILPVGVNPLEPRITTTPISPVAPRPDVLTAPYANYVATQYAPTREQQTQFRQKTGQHLLSKNNRFGVYRRSHLKHHGLPEADWAIALFGDDSAENPDDSHDSSQLDMFGDEVFQGSSGDCFLIASILALLKCPRKGKTYLASMIDMQTWQPANSPPKSYFVIRFPGYPDEPQYVNVDSLNYEAQAKGGIGYRLLEMAFAQLNQSRKTSITGTPGLNFAEFEGSQRLGSSLSHINGGGYPHLALLALTGQHVARFHNQPGCDKSAKKSKAWPFAPVTDGLTQLSQPDAAVVAVTCTRAGPDNETDTTFADQEKRFPYCHAYTLLASPHAGQLVVMNPWDSKKRGYDITASEFNQYFDDLYLVSFTSCHNDHTLANWR